MTHGRRGPGSTGSHGENRIDRTSTLEPVPEFSNPDTAIPLIIICVCAILAVASWVFMRGRQPANAVIDAAPTPIVGQTQVTQAQLGVWHRAHGGTVKAWIENHERVLKQVSDGGMSIDLSADLTAGHERLGPAIDEAIAKHPAAPMRAQLSALVLASRNTIESLRRSNWTNAEEEHLVYLEYRDAWLDRLRQFTTAESQVAELRTMGRTNTAVHRPAGPEASAST